MLSLLALIIFSLELSHLRDASVAQAHYPDDAKSVERIKKISREWRPATYRGLTMGKSTRADVIRVLGEPKWSELFDEDKSNPEHWYHYDCDREFPGELVFNVDKRSGIILRITLHPRDLSRKEAITRFGENYIVTRYEFCQGFEEQESAPLCESPSGQFRYIEYRERGIALAIGNDDKVDFIIYVSQRIGNTSSK